MADRSVVVKLRAEVGSYIAGLQKAKTATTDFAKEVSGQGKQASADIQRIGTASVVAGGLMLAGFAKAAGTAANFEKELSNVRAVSGATADEMHSLSDAALAAGASTKLAGVTASDAARAEAELVKAGVSVSDTLGGALMGSLTLAAAGQLDFADAATIAAQAMNIFDLGGQDVSHVADVLAAAANKSAGDVGQFGDALRQGGLVAAQTGLSLEESVGALAAFADNALIGSDAGTSLKTMLQRLTPQSTEAAELMKKLGFSAYDVRGNFIGLEGLAGELSEAFKGMTVEQRNSAMATLFGSDAVRAANVLYEEGAAGISDYVAAVDDQGAAARMAAIQNDNLKGDIEALGGAFESALIENGSKATGALRAITQGATDMVGSFSAMPDTLQTVTLGLGGIVSTAAILGGGFITLAPKIEASSKALKGMNSNLANLAGNNLGKLSAGLAGVTAAIGVGVWAYGQASAASRQYKSEVAELATALDPVTKGQADLNEEIKNFLKAQSEGISGGALDALNQLDVSLADIQRSIKGGGDALDPLRAKVKDLGVDLQGIDLGKLDDAGTEEFLQRLADKTGISASALRGLIDEVEDWDNAAQDSSKATVDSAIANDTFTQSAVDAAVAANTAKDGTINWVAVLGDLAPEVAATGDAAEISGGQIDGMAGGMDDAETAAKDLKTAIENLMEPLDTRSALDQFSSGINDLGQHFADADAEVGEAQENMRERQEALNDLLNTPADQRGDNYSRQVEDARDAIVDAQARIDDAIAGTTRTLEGNSEAAIDNRDMLDQLTRDGTAAIEAAAADQTMSTEDVMYVRALMIAQMEDEAERLGLNKEQVGFYTDALRNIPLGEIRTDVKLTGAAKAIADAERLLALYIGLIKLNPTSTDVAQAEKFVGGRRTSSTGQRAATGGFVSESGIAPVYRAMGGPSGTDTVPAWLSPGEYVMQKSAVDRFGIGVMDSMNAGIVSAVSSSGGSSADYSRRVSIDAPISVVAPSPVQAAGKVQFRLRQVALQVQG